MIIIWDRSEKDIEALDTGIIQASGEVRALSKGYEVELLRHLKSYLKYMKQLGITTPVFIMLSLLGVKGYTIGGVQSAYSRRGQHPIDRDTVIVSEVMVESFECELTQVMRPVFDAVWNASGWPRSMNYDENGKWIG